MIYGDCLDCFHLYGECFQRYINILKLDSRRVLFLGFKCYKRGLGVVLGGKKKKEKNVGLGVVLGGKKKKEKNVVLGNMLCFKKKFDKK